LELVEFKSINWNKHIVLLKQAQELGFVGASDVNRHLESSFLFYQCIKRFGGEGGINTLMDIGSGGGIPGLVIAKLLKHTKILLIESSKKRSSYLNSSISYLGLSSSVSVFAGSVQTYKSKFAETRFNVGTARLFGSLPASLECLAPLIADKGTVIISAHGSDEIIKNRSFDYALSELGVDFVEKTKFQNHWFWIFKKVHEADKKYPRTKREIKTDPLFEIVRNIE
jgi:16S rRNA G527 N7-methylase RsmG